MISASSVELLAIPDFPRVTPGDDLAAHIANFPLQQHDIVVLAQKIVSKAEGRIVDLASVTPDARAIEVAAKTEKDPRLVQLVLEESADIMRAKPGLLITRHRLGFIMANAGIDASNVGRPGAVILLPVDPDASARRIAADLKRLTGHDIGVIITDSWGRPWRLGTTGFAIGQSGPPAVRDMRGVTDMDGRILETTVIGTGDELAAAASLLMGQAAEAKPAIVIRGFVYEDSTDTAAALIRPAEGDLFQ
ncbi:MAG: coenzyme F420-0:L-glutamate ligase [Rhodobacteraceae bacterium]|nr:coenzyme F420-0:L-glutamate ligase [Paracoccaceae bacterium]